MADQRTWGYRVVAHKDGEDVTFGIHEVHYAGDMPIGMTEQPAILSDTRDFAGVFRQLEDAVSRPLHDPDNPVPAPRTPNPITRALSYPDGITPRLGYLPLAEEADMIPLTVEEMITYHRQWAATLTDMVNNRPDLLHGDLIDKAKSDIIMSLRVAKSLAALGA